MRPPARPRAPNGRLLPTGTPTEELPLILRFLQYVDPAIPRDASGIPDLSVCWTWVGTRKQRRSGPVGWFRYQGRSVPATRIALAIKTGELRPDDQACHTRDCPTGGLCVNFEHLYWGSQQDNINDHVALYGVWGRNKKYGRSGSTTGRETATADHGGPDGPSDGCAAGAETEGGAAGAADTECPAPGTESAAAGTAGDDDDAVPF